MSERKIIVIIWIESWDFQSWAKEGWFPEALFNASAVMWSGLI